MLAYEIILHRDASVTSGMRGKYEQDDLFDRGRTTVRWPDSKHNVEDNPDCLIEVDDSLLSQAIDIIPYPTTDQDWKNRIYWIEWSSWVKGLASGLGISVISGYDWDNDYDYGEDEQSFWDGPHFQLVKESK